MNSIQMPHQQMSQDISLWLVKEVADVKKLLQDLKQSPEITSSWLPRSQVMAFFGYGDTQMAALEKSRFLVVTKVGNRKFIHRDSILSLLQANIL